MEKRHLDYNDNDKTIELQKKVHENMLSAAESIAKENNIDYEKALSCVHYAMDKDRKARTDGTARADVYMKDYETEKWTLIYRDIDELLAFALANIDAETGQDRIRIDSTTYNKALKYALENKDN